MVAWAYLLVILLTIIGWPSQCISAGIFGYAGTMHAGDVVSTAILPNEQYVSVGEDKRLIFRSLRDNRLLGSVYLDVSYSQRILIKVATVESKIFVVSRAREGKSHYVEQIDRQTGATIRSHLLKDIVLSDLIFADDSRLFLADRLKRRLVEYSLPKDSIVRQFDLKEAPLSICYGNNDSDRAIYVGTLGGSLYKIDHGRFSGNSLDVASPIYDIDCSGERLALSLLKSNEVVFVDRSSLVVSSRVSLAFDDENDQYLNICSNSIGDVYAAGSVSKNQKIQLIKLPQENPQKTLTKNLGTNSVLDLQCMADRVVASTADPAVFMRTLSLDKVSTIGPVTADYRNVAGRLLYDHSKKSLQYSIRFGGRVPREFNFDSLSSREIYKDQTRVSGNQLSCGEAKQLTDVRRALGGSRCIDASIYGDRLIVASDWKLVLLEKVAAEYKTIKLIETESRTYGLQFYEGDGSRYIVASSDGKVRWFHWSQSKPYFTLFLHRNGHSWFIANTEGEYSGSADIHDFMRKYDQERASYLKLDGSRNDYLSYLAPDDKYQKEKSIAELRPAGNKSSAKKAYISPTEVKHDNVDINIVFPQAGQRLSDRKVDIKIQVSGIESVAKSDIVILADGQPVSISRGVGQLFTAQLSSDIKIVVPKTETASPAASKGRLLTFSTVIPRGTRSLSTAYTLNGIRYSSDPVQIFWDEKVKQESKLAAPRIIYLGFGMERYSNEELELFFTNDDVADLAGALKASSKLGGLKVFKNATRKNFVEGFEWLQGEVQSQDLVVIFLAGHGTVVDGQFYLLPVDVNPRKIHDSAISDSFLGRELAKLPARTLVLMDACYSGAFVGSNLFRMDSGKAALDLRDKGASVVVFASSSGLQLSQENTKWKNGAFTEALLEVFDRKAEMFQSDAVTLQSLNKYVVDRVSELTGGEQTPVMSKPRGVDDYNLL